MAKLDVMAHLGEIEAKFWQRVTPKGKNECWEWQGARLKNYGILYQVDKTTRKRGREYAHRLSWVVHYKSLIPAGLFICHYCDNPPCVNINHLWIGQPHHNTRDMILKGRSAKHPTKLNDEKMEEAVRKYYVEGKTLKAIAAEFEVGQTAIHRYKSLKKFTSKYEPRPLCPTKKRNSWTKKIPFAARPVIKERARLGEPLRRIAREYGVWQTAIKYIVNPDYYTKYQEKRRKRNAANAKNNKKVLDTKQT